jgi:hypothetical protein
MGQMMMCTPYMFDYYLYIFFVKSIDNKKIEKSDVIDNDVYILYVKRIIFNDF